MSFRDDREALLGRVAALEAELGREREGSAAQRELAGELDTLAAQVRTATGELEQDRAALREVGAAVERLRRRVSPAASPAPAATAPSAASVSAPPQGGGRFVVFGLAVIVAVLGLVLVLARTGKESPSPQAPVESDEARQARITRAADETINSRAFMPFSCDITSEPAGAEVLHRDVVLGKTPLRLRLGDGDSLYNYRVQLAGHDHAWLDIPNQLVGCKLHVELRPRPASR